MFMAVLALNRGDSTGVSRMQPASAALGAHLGIFDYVTGHGEHDLVDHD
jgi:hypothetical protein